MIGQYKHSMFTDNIGLSISAYIYIPEGDCERGEFGISGMTGLFWSIAYLLITTAIPSIIASRNPWV